MNNIKKYIILIIFIISIPVLATAQNNLYGSIWNIEFDKKLNKKFDLSTEFELRTIYYLRLIERGSWSLQADYNLSKHIDLGAGYELKNQLDTKYAKYLFQKQVVYTNRGQIEIPGDFTFKLREKSK
ncbi:MAG: hypothetical protein R2771_01250 [Saprospiraceae bacterium]